MTVRTILTQPDTRLNEVCAELVILGEAGAFDAAPLVEDLRDTLAAASNGLALAAPQIGVLERAVAIWGYIAEPTDELRDGSERGTFQSSIMPMKDEPPEFFTHRRILVNVMTPLVLLNPRILGASEKLGDSIAEECLSMPGLRRNRKRSVVIHVEAFVVGQGTRQFVASGFPAMALQHEFDHLEGITLYDDLSRQQRRLYQRREAKK